jgi:hypothetical protein
MICGANPGPSAAWLGRHTKERAMELSRRHGETIGKIFAHPLNHNIEWHDVVTLLEDIGSVEHEHNVGLRVTLGDHSKVLRPPHHGHDDVLDEQQVIDLRRIMTHAGITP